MPDSFDARHWEKYRIHQRRGGMSEQDSRNWQCKWPRNGQLAQLVVQVAFAPVVLSLTPLLATIVADMLIQLWLPVNLIEYSQHLHPPPFAA